MTEASARRGMGVDVLTAARQRIARTFDDFDRVCVSFSAGKDSTVMLHLVAEEARRRGFAQRLPHRPQLLGSRLKYWAASMTRRSRDDGTCGATR